MGRKRNTVEDVWRHVDIRSNDQCWPYTGALDWKGYGIFSIGKKSYRAHRIALKAVKEFPDALHVLHACDNRSCCNPAHLFLGTNEDNVADKMNKGRHRAPKGEAQGRSKLTEPEAFFIRYSDMDAKSLADVFEISVMTVRDIKNRRSWGHVA